MHFELNWLKIDLLPAFGGGRANITLHYFNYVHIFIKSLSLERSEAQTLFLQERFQEGINPSLELCY
jgi:hypothetical protein